MATNQEVRNQDQLTEKAQKYKDSIVGSAKAFKEAGQDGKKMLSTFDSILPLCTRSTSNDSCSANLACCSRANSQRSCSSSPPSHRTCTSSRPTSPRRAPSKSISPRQAAAQSLEYAMLGKAHAAMATPRLSNHVHLHPAQSWGATADNKRSKAEHVC